MARRYFDDRTNRQVPADECTTLKVAGPLAGMTGRREFHLDKSNALALAVWLGYPVARPEIPTVEGPGSGDSDLDRDATAADLAPRPLMGPARVAAIQDGQAAGTSAPPPKGKARPSRKEHR